MAGYLSGSSTVVDFAVPLDKFISDLNVTMECTDFTVRGTGGYILRDVDISQYTVTIYKHNNLLRVTVQAPEALSGTNNTPVTVTGSMKFTFS